MSPTGYGKGAEMHKAMLGMAVFALAAVVMLAKIKFGMSFN